MRSFFRLKKNKKKKIPTLQCKKCVILAILTSLVVFSWVTSFRVNGDLSVSRAFGDPDFKGVHVQHPS